MSLPKGGDGVLLADAVVEACLPRDANGGVVDSGLSRLTCLPGARSGQVELAGAGVAEQQQALGSDTLDRHEPVE